mgnify:CR=1 FL=1
MVPETPRQKATQAFVFTLVMFVDTMQHGWLAAWMDTADALLVRHQDGRTQAKAAGTLTSDHHAGGFVGGLDGTFGLAMPTASVRAAIRCP